MRRERHADKTLKALSDALKALCAPDPHTSHWEPVLLTTAEASTGGLLSATITATPGSSAYFERGFNVYSNPSKVELLDVKEETLQKYGAVSAPCTRELALGALRHSHAHVALAVSGVSGPTGGTPEKPVGLTYITLALKGAKALERLKSEGSPLRTLYDAQSATLLYTGAFHFLFTGKATAREMTLTETYAIVTLTDANKSAGAAGADSATLTDRPVLKGALKAGDGTLDANEPAPEAREPAPERRKEPSCPETCTPGTPEAPETKSALSQGACPALPTCPALHKVEVLVLRPDPQAYPLHSEAYALRARMQEAVVRETLSALGACLKGEPLLDYVEYINKVNFQDNSENRLKSLSKTDNRIE